MPFFFHLLQVFLYLLSLFRHTSITSSLTISTMRFSVFASYIHYILNRRFLPRFLHCLSLTESKDVRSVQATIPRDRPIYFSFILPPPLGLFYIQHCAPGDNLEIAKRKSLHLINTDGNVIDLPRNFLRGLLFIFHPRTDNKNALTTLYRVFLEAER